MIRLLSGLRPLGWMLVISLAGLSGCGSQPGSDIPAQQWQGLEVHVESRPSPAIYGMNEFLVIVNGSRGQPAWDCLVELRTAQADSWKQAIQDGRVGVYRRAALVEPGERSTLQVRVKRNDSETVLHFPLKPVKP